MNDNKIPSTAVNIPGYQMVGSLFIAILSINNGLQHLYIQQSQSENYLDQFKTKKLHCFNVVCQLGRIQQ